jgi:hypothetical protein
LEAAKEKVRELFGELFEDPPQLILGLVGLSFMH